MGTTSSAPAASEFSDVRVSPRARYSASTSFDRNATARQAAVDLSRTNPAAYAMLRDAYTRQYLASSTLMARRHR